jgi:GxxExxY protein
MDLDLIGRKVIGRSFAVHNQLGFGFPEKVYERALVVEWDSAEGLIVRQQYAIPVYCNDKKVGG